MISATTPKPEVLPFGIDAGVHRRKAAEFSRKAEALEGTAQRISMGRLFTFVGAAVAASAGFSQGSIGLIALGLGFVVAFLVLVFAHARTLKAREAAELRKAVHERHLLRVDGRFAELRSDGGAPDSGHPYAFDIDLIGPGSLFQRIDVSHTVAGERHLREWLSAPADAILVRERQAAVRELARAEEFRQELEAEAGETIERGKLDGAPFLKFLDQTPYFERARWLAVAIHVLPLVTVGLAIAGSFGTLPAGVWLVPLSLQTVLVLMSGGHARETFDRIAARQGYVESFRRMLCLVEGTAFDAPLLRDAKARMAPHGTPPSHYLARLDRWTGLADLRHQVLFHVPVNFFFLWDLHVLLRLERWRRDVGVQLVDVFEALGEIEALASLATLLAIEPTATLPEVQDEPGPFEAVGLAHPLLHPDHRVPNDVRLPGPSSALLVTGSNMAGKSTLLRAVGLNVALALAGGPVLAETMRLCRVRLRASMRAEDSVQRGSSYFHAELTKLRGVVDGANEGSPIFFLLDELLRGTNARARHLGARAILVHLLDRGAMGLAATHDVALASLEEERPGYVSNAHFTDVMREGEMVFDYRLREGVVKTSNALRLLKMAGIDVPEDDSLPEGDAWHAPRATTAGHD